MRRATGLALASLGALLLPVTPTGAAPRHASASRLATRFLVGVWLYHPLRARLEIVSKRGEVIRLVASGGAGDGQASLSPNHKLIEWVGTGGVNVEQADGSEARSLDLPAALIWSPDSRRFLVHEADGGLGIVSLSTGANHEIIAPTQESAAYRPVAWSGPAQAILFVAYSSNGSREKLAIARPDGSAQRTIYSSHDVQDDPRVSWSPNGKWISFTTDGVSWQDPRLAIVNAASGATRRVRNFKGYTAPPAWAPDSTRFATGGPQEPIVIFSPAGKQLRTLTPASAAPVAWTPGGIYYMGTGPRELFVIPRGQSRGRIVFALPKGQQIGTVEPF